MIETTRPAPARVLKQRDLAAALAQPAAESFAPVASGESPASAPRGAGASQSAPARAPSPPAARCVAKEARLVASDGGATAIEVRCSCGEWTRVELATGAGGEGTR